MPSLSLHCTDDVADVREDDERLIRVMPDTLANKIAAGEVVQRPASALKELVENAIDAGGDQVEVLLKSAGSELIQVIDNGCGMHPDDAVDCFRRHATSKIRSVDDLERLQTLGFRGEALASISAVAQVELRTRRLHDPAGFRVRVDGGATVLAEPCATPAGTSIAVRNLFYNVPARRNFLKTPATEFKHLVETFQFLALANPAIGFTLRHDDNEVYRLPAVPGEDRAAALRRRIADLLGKQHAEEALWVEETTSYLSVSGYVSRPEFHRRSRGEQFLFVNGRYVKNRSLDYAVLHAYEDLLPDGAYPFYALFLRLDPRHVDVNVHPTKAEIKFDDERGVYGFLKAVVRKALGTADLTPQLDAEAGASRPAAMAPFEGAAAPTRPAAFSVPSAPATVGGTATRVPAGATSARGGWEPPGEPSRRLYAPSPEASEEAAGTNPSSVAAEDLERETGEPLLWQLHNRYILTQIRSGLMILDQHAAHERILYERALQSFESGLGMSQQLLFPHTLDFSPADFELLRELMPDLRALGFDLEVFSGRSVVVRGVPADLRPGDERRFLDDLLQQYRSYQQDLHLRGRDNLARSIAHRSAIRPGDRLTEKEMRTLIDQLFLCEMPYASPHGRPTIIKISIDELDKRFGRD